MLRLPKTTTPVKSTNRKRKRNRNPTNSTQNHHPSSSSSSAQPPLHESPESHHHHQPPPMEIDRFSTLSDDVLLTILLLLPTKQSVSLSALSRRFRHVPTLLPRRDMACPTSPNAFLLRRLETTSPPHAPLIEAAADRGVKEISIHLDQKIHPKPVPENLFTLKSVTVLSLKNVKVPCSIKKNISTMPLLRTLKLYHVIMLDRVIEKLLDSVPVVEIWRWCIVSHCTSVRLEGIG